MIDRSSIRQHMDVIASDGERIGRVDEVEGDRLKLTKDSSSDGQHHHVDLSDVARVDEHVHLSKARAALGLAAAATAGAAAAGTRDGATPANPLPPIRNPAVDGATPRRNYILPWVLAGLALLALILALTQCDNDKDRARPVDVATPEVVTPRVAGAPLREGTLAYDLDRFMGSKDGLPRTFTFDAVNFDSGTANLRAADSGDLDDIARVLAAYPDSRAAIVGYADAQGDSDFNRDLGANRAKAVVAALASRGVPADRLEARTGGESDPTATNATRGGRFENRRTELVILKR
jgi:outer membrane protein OmpA-like peptidoglycan-associated protein